jgi:hypothetical protein
MHGDIDRARNQGPLDFTRENSFPPGAWIERGRLSFVTACLDEFDRNFEIRPRALERFGHHGCLSARKLTPA